MSTKKGLDTQTILSATAELAEEKGLESVSLLQVANRLGVKSPSLYNHLNGFQKLSTGLAKLALTKLDSVVRNAAVGRSKDDALTAIAIAYREFAKENPELYKAILRFPDYRDNGIQEVGHAVVRILYQVMEPYHYSKEDTIHFIRGFRSALHGFISLEEVGFFQGTKANVDKSYEHLITRFLPTLTIREES